MMQITHASSQWGQLCRTLALDPETASYGEVLVKRVPIIIRNTQRQPRVYVAGPYTQGDVAVNVRKALDLGDWLSEQYNCVPYVPHLSHFAPLVNPRPYESWIAQDLAWLRVCDALVRLPGPSAGADGEVAEAQRLHIPVFMAENTSEDALFISGFFDWRKEWGE